MGGHGQRRRLIVKQEAPDSFSFPACKPLAALPDAPQEERALVPLKPYEKKDQFGFHQLAALKASEAQVGSRPVYASHDQVEMELPERFAGIILGDPYSIRLRLKIACGGVHLDTLPSRAPGESITVFRLHGPGSMVEKAVEMVEEQLMDAYRQEGVANVELEMRVGQRQADRRVDDDVHSVNVTVDGTVESVKVHKEKGPMWLMMDGSYRNFSKEGNGGGGFFEKPQEWLGLGPTDKEVALITAARRQRLVRRRWMEMHEAAWSGQ